MVVSSSTRLLDSLSQKSVPAWLIAKKSNFQPNITQGVLAWQATTGELLASVRHCSRQKTVTTTTAIKLWVGYGTDSLCRSSWYSVGSVKAVGSRGGRTRVKSRNALPGTVLDIKPNGVTVAVADGAVRLSNFLTPLGRPLLPNQLPLTIGQRLPRLTAFQQRAIAQFEQGIAEHESTWHQRLTELSPLQLPHGDCEPGLGSIFARLPLELEPLIVQGSEEFQDCLSQFGSGVLLTALTGYLMGLCQPEAVSGQPSMSLPGESGPEKKSTCRGDIGLRSTHLQQMLCSEELTALFASHVPARFTLDLNEALAHNLAVVLEELQFLEEAATHRQDLVLGVNEAKLPSLYPVLMEVVTEISEAPHRLGQVLTIQVTESGGACVWFYNPAVLGEEDVAQMQMEFIRGLQAIALNPEAPFSCHW